MAKFTQEQIDACRVIRCKPKKLDGNHYAWTILIRDAEGNHHDWDETNLPENPSEEQIAAAVSAHLLLEDKQGSTSIVHGDSHSIEDKLIGDV